MTTDRRTVARYLYGLCSALLLFVFGAVVSSVTPEELRYGLGILVGGVLMLGIDSFLGE